MLSHPPVSRRPFFISSCCLSLVVASAGSLIQGATIRPTVAAQPPTLSFRMTTRYSYKEGPGESAGPQQVYNARVHVRGNSARAEFAVSGRPLVMIYAPPSVYRLLPSSKTGIRYRLNAAPGAGGLPANLSPQALLSNPPAIRAALKQYGAKRVGSGKLNGEAVDIYTATNFRGQGQNAKAWLRRSDALPLRMELSMPRANVVASWSEYRRGHKLPATLFTVPVGYRVRDAA